MIYRIYYSPEDWIDGEGPGVCGEQARGVQAILQYHPSIGHHVQSQHDYYIWRDDRWMGVDIFGLFDYLLDSGIVLFGRTLLSDDYHKVMESVMAERARRRNGST